MNDILVVSLLGLATTSSAMAGAAIGLYYPISKRSLACILAFTAGALISALAIAHAMIPEALHGGGSLIVLPTVAGFLFALYLSLAAAFV
jgi:hypothetical protein